MLLRPLAVQDALLQLLLCCPASTPFVLPAAAIEELQDLLLDQRASVLQLLRVFRLLLYKFFFEHPFAFFSLDVQTLLAAIANGDSTSNKVCNNSTSTSSCGSSSAHKEGVATAGAALPGGSSGLEELERRVAVLAAAVLTPQHEAILLQQLNKFPLLYEELCAAIPTKLKNACCRDWKISCPQRLPHQQEGAQGHEGCNKTPTCGILSRTATLLLRWWGTAGILAAADESKPAPIRSRALQQQVLPGAALQLVERRVAASVAMRLLVVLQQQLHQQRQAFALHAEEKAAALGGSSSSTTLSALSLLQQVISTDRGAGYHDYLLQGMGTASAAGAARTVSLSKLLNCMDLRKRLGY